ncbi:MAG: hypothetical protein ACYS80_07415, partial [Planctomycetota bacterium]
METTKRTVILLILVLLATGTTQSTEKPATEISGTRTASCLVKVTADPAILPLNFETIDYLLQSSGIGGKAAREVLGVSPDQIYDLFTIEYVQLHASDAGGGVGIPPELLRGGPSNIGGFDDGMSEYEYEMMKTEQPGAEQNPYSDPSESSGSSSVGRSTSDTLYGSSSSRRSRIATRSPSTTGTSYSRRRSRDRGSSYDYYSSRPTAASSRRTRTTTVQTAPAGEHMYLFNLNVHLPEEIKPAAKEFMNALVDNLRQTLTDAYRVYGKELQNLLRFAESQRDQAQLRLTKSMEQIKATGPSLPIKQNPADVAVHEQLEQIIDLSMLSVEMSFTEVISELKNSVDPPLQIQPHWKDLLENGEVEPATPTGMEPLTGIKLRKALEILLSGLSDGFVEFKYV